MCWKQTKFLKLCTFGSRIKNKNPRCCFRIQSKGHWRNFEVNHDRQREAVRQAGTWTDGRTDGLTYGGACIRLKYVIDTG